MNLELDYYFLYYLKNKLTNESIQKTRTSVIKSISPTTKITKNIVKKCFEEIDKLLFNSAITLKIKQEQFNLEFKTSKKYKNIAGTFSSKNKELIFTFSENILNNLFIDDVSHVNISGITCQSLEETIVILMEHEITHMILFLMKNHKNNIGTEKSGHTVTFKKFVLNLFGHTKVTHKLNLGDINKHNEQNNINKEILNVGDIVNFKNVEGLLVAIKGSTGIININNGEKYITSYLKDIKQIKKSSTDLEKTTIDNIKKLKSSFFNLKLGLKELTVQIVNFNNKSVKLKTSDNKFIKVYLWYLIGKF